MAAILGSPSWTRTNDTAVNSRVLYRLSYGGIFQASKKKPVLALPIFPGRLQPSIVGRSELNYRVRNGNGWTLTLINTNCAVLYQLSLTLSRKTVVTRTGFEPMLTA